MDKKSFLIYLDYEDHFNLLTDEQIGQLIRAIIHYEKTGEEPKLDGMLKMAFSFIKTQLDRDREKYNNIAERNKRNAKKRWEKNNTKNATGKTGKPKETKNADTDKDTDTDTDNEINKEKIKKKFIKPTIDEIKKYCLEKKYKIDCQYFYDYYQSNGWKVGKNPMKDWQATIRTWQRRNKSDQTAEEEFLNE